MKWVDKDKWIDSESWFDVSPDKKIPYWVYIGVTALAVIAGVGIYFIVKT